MGKKIYAIVFLSALQSGRLRLHLISFNGYWMLSLVFCAGYSLRHHILCLGYVGEEDVLQASPRASRMADRRKSVSVGEEAQRFSLPPR